MIFLVYNMLVISILTDERIGQNPSLCILIVADVRFNCCLLQTKIRPNS